MTPTAARQAELMISYRRLRLDWLDSREHASSWSVEWPVDPEMIKARLEKAGYADDSINWLEHYNAACQYALALVVDDDTQGNDSPDLSTNNEHAYAAIAALDRAARYGDKVEFVTSKKYWLQAEDPDLAGLRYRQSFRAFEARIYGHPLPATAELSKYELYRFLRAVVRRAARDLEDQWRKRGARNPRDVSHAEFEEWWRQELRAWEVAIRIGRFYGQWQTRHAALMAIRDWFESLFGPEALPIPYPDITEGDYIPHIGDYALVKRRLTETEDIFAFLGTKCGNLVTTNKVTSKNVYENTRRWSEYAASYSRSGKQLPVDGLTNVCLARSAVWASLRQWAQSPGDKRQQILEKTIRRLPTPRPRVKERIVQAATARSHREPKRDFF